MSKTIQIIVSPTGETKIETTGFSGGACKDATRELERALGAVTDDQLTGEYYTETNEQQNEIQN
jgi:hypothetical protein